MDSSSSVLTPFVDQTDQHEASIERGAAEETEGVQVQV